MPSSYLTSGDYANYELPSTTTQSQVTAASNIIDAYLRRPEGLVWVPDATGAPGWMVAPTPSLTLMCAGPIEPGNNVVVTVTGGTTALTVGDVLILDAANGTIAEPVAVVSITMPTPPAVSPAQITLQAVVFTHVGPVTMDKGLVIKQHKFMPAGRPLTVLAYTPIARLLAGQGRYGYGRRGDASRYQVDEFNLLASLSHFGGPPVWEFFPISNTGVDPQSGQVWLPAGVMLAYYSETNIWYVAGFQASNLPSEIKTACASIILAKNQIPQMGAAKMYKAGDTSITLGAASYLSDDTKSLLDPYRARLFA